MAAISITVDDDFFVIELDQYEWASLTVNGVSIPAASGGIKFK